MLLILILLSLVLWFFTYQRVEGVDEGVEDIIEEGLSIEEINKQLQGTPQQPGSETIINEPKISILEQLANNQASQISDIQAMLATLKAQKLANKPDNKLPA